MYRIITVFALLLATAGCRQLGLRQHPTPRPWVRSHAPDLIWVRVPDPSMHDKIVDRQKIMVETDAYHRQMPMRTDLVVYRPLLVPARPAVFRVAALPGETVTFRNGQLLVNERTPASGGWEADVQYEADLEVPAYSQITFPYTVPPDSYFLISENPEGINDSRVWGAVPRTKLIGRVGKKWGYGYD